jgi:hypothetical protein
MPTSKLTDLERVSTETQWAGGFAHEMRNALSASQLGISAMSGGARPLALDIENLRAMPKQGRCGEPTEK